MERGCQQNDTVSPMARDLNLLGIERYLLTSGPESNIAGGRRRDCHFADTPSASLLIHLLEAEGGAAE